MWPNCSLYFFVVTEIAPCKVILQLPDRSHHLFCRLTDPKDSWSISNSLLDKEYSREPWFHPLWQLSSTRLAGFVSPQSSKKDRAERCLGTHLAPILFMPKWSWIIQRTVLSESPDSCAFFPPSSVVDRLTQDPQQRECCPSSPFPPTCLFWHHFQGIPTSFEITLTTLLP